MDEIKDTYCYKLLDGDEIVRIGITDKPHQRELHYERKRERGEYKYTDFRLGTKLRSREEALSKEAERIKKFERKYGRKPRYNKQL